MPDIGNIYRQLGLCNGGFYLLDQALRRLTSSRALIQRYYLVTQPVEIKTRLPRRMGARYRVKIIGANDPEVTDLNRPSAVLSSRFEQNSTCIALYEESNLVGFIWFCMDEYFEEEVNCRFRPSPAESVAWDFDIFIEPEHRNGIAFLKLWTAALEYLKSNGVQWSASQISAYLPQSIASHQRLGAVVVGRATFFRLFGLQLTIATLAPFIHIGWGRRGPTITVAAPERATDRTEAG